VHQFTYFAPESLDAAVTALAADSVPLAGGTDLLVEIEEGLRRPATLVDVRRVRELHGVTSLADGTLRIGAATTLATVERDAAVRESYPLLARAVALAASSALRNMSSIAGNLCQRPRCWYFRRGVRCYKSGGDACPARDGENQYLAVLGGGPCYAVHPSDPAVALSALGASVQVAGAGARRVPLQELYDVPNEQPVRETVLTDEELIVHVDLPPEAAGGTQFYEKVTQRQAWDFALVALAAAKRRDGAVRMVLGGVAARPWRISESVEEDVASGGLSDDDFDTLAERALYDATPLARNAYKLDIAAALLRRGMRALHNA
jgi:xanthine dehydrogenase YagS FAD-binding subunit